VRYITLVDETGRIDHATLAAVAAALQIQVDRDLVPEWGGEAVIGAGTRDGVGRSWRVSVLDPARVPAGLAGVHLHDAGQPFALVAISERWTVAASHEVLEMLVNPYGRRFVSGPSLEPGTRGRAVQYLHEVCGPCQTFSYVIDGVEVSDFVLAGYYQPGSAGPVDRMARLAGPFDVPTGGFLSWLDPADNRWRQLRGDGTVVAVPQEDGPDCPKGT
jgi:hypothetical protein